MSLERAWEVLTVEAEGIFAVRDNLGDEFIKAVDLIMACPSRLVITGIGKSGLVGQKISATLNSTGTPSFFLHPVEAMHGDLGMVSSTDVVLALSNSGETIELNGLLASLKERAVKIIAMTGNLHSTLAGYAAVTLNVAVPREACPLGLAPTSSTTATLALGDALALTTLQQRASASQICASGTQSPQLQVDGNILTGISVAGALETIARMQTALSTQQTLLQSERTRLETRIPALQEALAQAAEELDRCRQARNQAKTLYLDLKAQQAALETLRLANRDLATLSLPAMPRETPVSPKPLQNTLLAALLGGMLGVMWVFGKGWWVDENNTENNNV
jgi:KpsF/GutQ family protein